jgi:isochorismate pyruvate lyase
MSREPEACTTMDELRVEIDRIDRDLVRLLARRAACIDRAAEIKRGNGLPARIESRVEDVVAKVRAEAEMRGLDAAAVEALWRAMIDWSIAREERVLGRGTDG